MRLSARCSRSNRPVALDGLVLFLLGAVELRDDARGVLPGVVEDALWGRRDDDVFEGQGFEEHAGVAVLEPSGDLADTSGDALDDKVELVDEEDEVVDVRLEELVLREVGLVHRLLFVRRPEAAHAHLHLAHVPLPLPGAHELLEVPQREGAALLLLCGEPRERDVVTTLDDGARVSGARVSAEKNEKRIVFGDP